MVATKSPYDLWEASQQWRQNAYRKAVHKALDIPEDDVNINTNSGMGWKELLVGGVVMLATIGGMGWLLKDNPPLVPPLPPPPANTAVLDSAYDVLFFDAEGNPISISPLEE